MNCKKYPNLNQETSGIHSKTDDQISERNKDYSSADNGNHAETENRNSNFENDCSQKNHSDDLGHKLRDEIVNDHSVMEPRISSVFKQQDVHIDFADTQLNEDNVAEFDYSNVVLASTSGHSKDSPLDLSCPVNVDVDDSSLAGPSQLICPVCNGVFNDEHLLAVHCPTHAENTVSNVIFDHSYSKKSELKHQRNTHTDITPYECDRCDKSFSQKGNLKIHKRIHTGQRPYECNKCEKNFIHQSHLIKHIEKCKSVSEFKNYTCDKCPKNFPFKHLLEDHNKVHTGEKPHECKKCGKGFASKSYLKIHQEICRS